MIDVYYSDYFIYILWLIQQPKMSKEEEKPVNVEENAADK